MTWEEEQAVAKAITGLRGLGDHCFQTLKEAQDVAKKAGQIRKLWSGAHTIDLGQHNLSGYVVRVVGTDGQACVIFENGDTIPLNVLKSDAEHGQSPWD